MSRQDVETFQSFCLRYINRAVKNHFADIDEDDIDNLSLTSPRQVIKRICTHRDSDPMTLTVGRLLIYYFETKNLLDEYIYGIPATTFHETVKFKPQIKLFWREKTADATANNRYPIRAQYSVRYRGEYETSTQINVLSSKLNRIFNQPSNHSFEKGREKYSYRDKSKGYEFIITAKNEIEAKKVINALLEIQDDNPLQESLLTKSTTERDWQATDTFRVDSELYKTPKQRPIGKVYFTHAELAVYGMPKSKILINNLGERVSTRYI